jgi:IS5 family transposase
MRTFAGLGLGRDTVPDETTILNFRHLLEAHELTKVIFVAIRDSRCSAAWRTIIAATASGTLA